MGGSETQSMMSVDNMSVDSGPESEYDFDDFEKPKAESNPRQNRASSVQRLSRIMVLNNHTN